MRNREETINAALWAYLSGLDKSSLPGLKQIGKEALVRINEEFEGENTQREKEDKFKKMTTLSFGEAAQIISFATHVAKIPMAGEDSGSEYDMIYIYQESGTKKGLYVRDEDAFRTMACKLIYPLSDAEFKETMILLRTMCTRKTPCSDDNLIAVNNGLYDRKADKLKPFTPDLVFLSKSMVDYNPKAVNVNIHNDADNTDWDVESWMQDLHNDKAIVTLLWQLIGACIRPNTNWNKTAWLYSETGNNGKGTLCKLIRNICGPGSHTSISISSFAQDFALEKLLGVSAVITDENDVGVFIDKSANLKAAVTGDVIEINRKYKAQISYRFRGFMIQCINGLPRVKDKSGSFYRRCLFIPMEKCFTGAERTYIKDDYLNRQEVLEYVLYRVLHMSFNKLSEPDACKIALEEYKEFNDPVRYFWEEMADEFVWDLLPAPFLYDLFNAWYYQNHNDTSKMSSKVFAQQLGEILKDDPEWEWPDKRKKIRTSGRMDDYEPLLTQYELTKNRRWCDTAYRGSDEEKIADFKRAENYRGVTRKSAVPNP